MWRSQKSQLCGNKQKVGEFSGYWIPAGSTTFFPSIISSATFPGIYTLTTHVDLGVIKIAWLCAAAARHVTCNPRSISTPAKATRRYEYKKEKKLSVVAALSRQVSSSISRAASLKTDRPEMILDQLWLGKVQTFSVLVKCWHSTTSSMGIACLRDLEPT